MVAFIPRLYVPGPLAVAAEIMLSPEQAHYLRTVLRLAEKDDIHIFNGVDGEWLARLVSLKKNGGVALGLQQRRAQIMSPDVWLLFAPIKRPGIDLIAEKATELGAACLWPVFTRNTGMDRVNLERLTAQSIAAAEQCERLDTPLWRPPEKLVNILGQWPAERQLLVCAERSGAEAMAAALQKIPAGPMAILVGPEGGFAPDELEMMAAKKFVTFVTLGPRILRAETAVFSALSVWQSIAADS